MIKHRRRRSYIKNLKKRRSSKTSKNSKTSRTSRTSRKFGILSIFSNKPTIKKPDNTLKKQKIKIIKDYLFKSPEKQQSQNTENNESSFGLADVLEPIIPIKGREYFKGLKDYINKAANQFIFPPIDDKTLTFKQKLIKWFLTTKLGKKYAINVLNNTKKEIEDGNVTNILTLISPNSKS